MTEFAGFGIPWRRHFIHGMETDSRCPKMSSRPCRPTLFWMENFGTPLTLFHSHSHSPSPTHSHAYEGLGLKIFRRRWRYPIVWMHLKSIGRNSDTWYLIYPIIQGTMPNDMPHSVYLLPYLLCIFFLCIHFIIRTTTKWRGMEISRISTEAGV